MSLSVELVGNIHKELCKKYNVSINIKYNILEGIINKVSSFQTFSLSDDVFVKTATFFEEIIALYLFVDGNKRTALLVCIYYLAKNNIRLILPLDVARYVLHIAKIYYSDNDERHDQLKEIAKWLKNILS